MHPSAAKRTAPSDPLDPQKDALYDWEGDWHYWNVNTLTLAECRFVVAQAARRYKIPRPIVGQHHVRAMSINIPSINRISMQAKGPGNRGGKNVPTCLHEAAHAIVWHYLRSHPQDHGPTFLGVYLWLLEEARVAPREALHASARHFGLRWIERPPSFFK